MPALCFCPGTRSLRTSLCGDEKEEEKGEEELRGVRKSNEELGGVRRS